MIIFQPKAPGATEKFEFDFTARLGTDTINGDAELTADGITLDSHAVSGTKVDLVLSGGTEGTVAKVECTVATTGGETLYALGVVEIGGEVIDLATAKLAQKIDSDDEDALLAGLLRAAIRHIESRTSKNLTARIERQVMNGFGRSHGSQAIRLWKGPVSEILEVKYDDPDGIEQTLTSFRLLEGKDAKLLPAYGDCWPATACGEGTVRVSYVAGYDPADRDLAELGQAAILLFGHFNANREAVVAGDRAASVELPLGVEALVAPYCSIGIG